MTNRLKQPLKLPCGAVLANRLCKTSMSEGMADVNKHSSARLETLHKRLATSGAGLLLSGNIRVDPCHLERPLNIVIHDAGGKEQLARLAAAGESGDQGLHTFDVDANKEKEHENLRHRSWWLYRRVHR